ncbi:MAG: hypothetical protein ABFD86_08695 [Bryobacteraceae bacterium]
MIERPRYMIPIGLALASAVGALCFLGFWLCVGQLVSATERGRLMSLLVVFLLVEAALTGIVFAFVRLTPYFSEPTIARVIIFVAMASSALYGLYWGGFAVGAFTGIVGAVFASPCLLPIALGARIDQD